MSKKEIIVMLGLATSGKDYNAQIFIERGYVKVAFADALRSALWEVLEYEPKNNGEYANFKKNEVKYQVNPIKQHKITGRKLLQNIGSVFKKYTKNEKFWNLALLNTIKDNNIENAIITDCRFPYEIEDILTLEKDGYDVKFYWCCYSGNDYTKILNDNHESEALNQFIYHRQKVFGLFGDCCEIKKKTIKDILYFYKEHAKVFIDK